MRRRSEQGRLHEGCQKGVPQGGTVDRRAPHPMKTMTMRQFLRGGYREATEMTLITNHGRPYGTWMPQQHARPRKVEVKKEDVR